jgi:hypothetical protein
MLSTYGSPAPPPVNDAVRPRRLPHPSDDLHLSMGTSWPDHHVLLSSDAASSPLPLTPHEHVKPEPTDAFIQDQLSFPLPDPSSSSHHSSSCYPDLTSPAVVPLRASLVCGEMRAMMSVFRLNPFLYNVSEGSCAAAAAATPAYAEPGPLESEPVILEWWLDGAQRDIGDEDEQGEGVTSVQEPKCEQDLDALLRIRVDNSTSLEKSQDRMEDAWDGSLCLHASEKPQETLINAVTDEASALTCPGTSRLCASPQETSAESTYEPERIALALDHLYEPNEQLLASQTHYSVLGKHNQP